MKRPSQPCSFLVQMGFMCSMVYCKLVIKQPSGKSKFDWDHFTNCSRTTQLNILILYDLMSVNNFQRVFLCNMGRCFSLRRASEVVGYIKTFISKANILPDTCTVKVIKEACSEAFFSSIASILEPFQRRFQASPLLHFKICCILTILMKIFIERSWIKL